MDSRSRPVEWRGLAMERRSCAAVARLSDRRWRAVLRWRVRLLLGAGLVLAAAALASLTLVLADRVVVAERWARLARLERMWRERLADQEQRRCQEWPDWCREERGR